MHFYSVYAYSSTYSIQSNSIIAQAEDNLSDLIPSLKRLLKALPVYKKAVIVELFDLLSRVSEKSSINLMNADNIATIFGGMTNIIADLLSAPQRSMLVRLFIVHYDELFDDLNVIPEREDNHALDTVRDAVKVYLHDGTFKSLFVLGSETAKDITKKTLSKLQQTMDIDMSRYKMYELRNMSLRRIGAEEKLLAIWKSGSAILFTDQVKIDKKRSISRAIREPAEESSALQLLPDNASLVGTPNQVETLQNIETEFSAWMFPNIRVDSRRASDWDMESAISVEITVSVSEETKIMISYEAQQLSFSVENIYQVEDSSRYYVLMRDSFAVGIGFETRDMSADFLSIIGATNFNYTTPRKDIRPVPIDCSQSFSIGPILKINDGFYDAGLQSEGTLAEIQVLTEAEVNLDTREIILVDETKDKRLKKIVESARSLVDQIQDIDGKLICLSLFISNVLGGLNLSESFNDDKFSEDEFSLHHVSHESIRNIKARLNSNVIPLGYITHGTSRHRSILFKYIIDKLELVTSYLCRCDLIRFPDKEEKYWVLLIIDNQIAYIDLSASPGHLHKGITTEVKDIIELIHGELNIQFVNGS